MLSINQWIANLLPMVPKPLVKPFAKRYVAGETVDDMLRVVRSFHRQGIYSTIDVLGEFIHQFSEAEATADIYQQVLRTLASDSDKLNQTANVSIKLTAFGLLLDKEACYQLVRKLVLTAKETGNFVRIDMEDSPCTSDTIEIYLRLRKEFDNVGIVLQAYLKRTLQDAQEIISEGAGHFRLCKGIYVEPEELAYKRKSDIHENYLRVLEAMFQQGAYVGIATHHDELVKGALALIEKYKLTPEQYEFQMLLGVRPELRNALLRQGHCVRIYVPFGQDWYAYSIRRLKENPAIISHVLKNMLP